MPNVFFKSNGYQLTAANIEHKFANLTKIKHIGHVFHSILGLEFEVEDKNYNFTKSVHLCQDFDHHDGEKRLDITKI